LAEWSVCKERARPSLRASWSTFTSIVKIDRAGFSNLSLRKEKVASIVMKRGILALTGNLLRGSVSLDKYSANFLICLEQNDRMCSRGRSRSRFKGWSLTSQRLALTVLRVVFCLEAVNRWPPNPPRLCVKPSAPGCLVYTRSPCVNKLECWFCSAASSSP